MNCSKDKTSEVHSIVFKNNPPSKWTTKTAREWLDKHDFKRIKNVDRTKNSLRYRIVDPKCFKSFSTEVIEGKLGTINLVIGWYTKPTRRKAKEPMIKKTKPKKPGTVHFSSRRKKNIK